MSNDEGKNNQPDRQEVRSTEIFNEAIKIESSSERDAFIKSACVDDNVLLTRVEALLKVHFEEEGLHKSPLGGLNSTLETAPVIEGPGTKIGRFKLLQLIGEGGCGVVYMAEQERPIRRRVAFKIIKLGMDTKQVIARFEAERQALALMDHPNIAKVLDAGSTETGRPYFIMELVKGIKITDYCDQNNLSTEQRLGLFVQICHAVQHAHQKGIIHRDIKPSNILVTLHDGVPVPKIIDFGIAKATTGQMLTDKTLFTAYEQFIGTPAYMSPEQAEMSGLDVDTRSDIYALGVLLYELLTGQTPFDAKELAAAGLNEMRKIIREKEPPRPSTRISSLNADDQTTVAKRHHSEPPQLIHLVRGDLDWIVMKCLEKDRTRRYETASGVAHDVLNYLNNETVMARPPSRVYRLQKLVRRNKLVFASAAFVVIALVIGLGSSTWLFFKEKQARKLAVSAEQKQDQLRQQAEVARQVEVDLRQKAEILELDARQKAYASDMKLLQQALAVDDLGRAQVLLNRQRPRPGQKDLRGWEWRYLWQFCQSDPAVQLCQRSNSIVSLSFSSDGALLAVGTDGGELTVWDIVARQLIFHQQGSDEYRQESEGSYRRLSFAPLGDLLAYSDQNNVVLWNSRSRAEVRRLPLGGPARELAFTVDGHLFTVVSHKNQGVTLWDVETGNPITTFTAQVTGFTDGTVFSVIRDARAFAYVQGFRDVHIVNTAEGGEWSFQATDETVTGLAFSRNGRVLATGPAYSEGTIKLWDTQTHQLIGSLEGHRAWVACLKFLPDGKSLVSASADRIIRLWDFETRQTLRTFRGHRSEVWYVDVSQDGRRLASGDRDGTVFLWDLSSAATRPPIYRTLPENVVVRDWSFSPDSCLIGVVQNNKVNLYNATTLQLAGEPNLPLTNINRLAFSPDMRLLVATDTNGYLCVWDQPRQRVLTNFPAHRGSAQFFGSGFLSSGRGLLTWGADQVVREWDVASWQETRHWQMASNNNGATAVSPANRLAATVNGSNVIELVTLDDPARRRCWVGQDTVPDLAFSPDGKILASPSWNGTLELWDTENATRIGLLRNIWLGLHSVAFSPDGLRLIAGSGYNKAAIYLWDVNSQQEVGTLEGKGSIFEIAAFSPDGTTIGACNVYGLLHLWRAPSWEEIAEAEKTINEALAKK